MIPNHALIKTLARDHPSLTLVMASKYIDPEDFKRFNAAGITHFGESRVEAFLEKMDEAQGVFTWHFLGTLQSKKVKKMIHRIDYLHSLDRISLAKAIDKHRREPLKCFVQINISGEPQKHGVLPENAPAFLNNLDAFDTIEVIGLMGIAENTDDKKRLRSQFARLRTLRDALAKTHPGVVNLSMGMSNDYTIAIEEGATHIRLGRTLIKEDDHEK